MADLDEATSVIWAGNFPNLARIVSLKGVVLVGTHPICMIACSSGPIVNSINSNANPFSCLGSFSRVTFFNEIGIIELNQVNLN